jgi:hypothetical protein
MKILIINFLLGRGINKLLEILSKSVRHGLTTYGGFLIADGHATADEFSMLQGGAVVAVGAALSIARTFIGKYAKTKGVR